MIKKIKRIIFNKRYPSEKREVGKEIARLIILDFSELTEHDNICFINIDTLQSGTVIKPKLETREDYNYKRVPFMLGINNYILVVFNDFNNNLEQYSLSLENQSTVPIKPKSSTISNLKVGYAG